jgi:hypothetical protein
VHLLIESSTKHDEHLLNANGRCLAIQKEEKKKFKGNREKFIK